MTTPAAKPWLVFFGIVGLYAVSSIILEAIGLSGKMEMECSNSTAVQYQQQHHPVRDQLCYPTTDYHFVRRVDQDSRAIILQSHYGSTEKTMGGDEFYPTIIFNNNTATGLGFMAVVDFSTSDFETCPKYQNWANFINKSTTES